MRRIVLNYDEPPKFFIKLNKLAGTTNEVFWRLNKNEQSGVYSAVDLTGFTAECQLKIKNADDCEFGTDADLITSFVLTNGNITLKTTPEVTVNNAWGFRLNLPPVLTTAFTWERAAGVVFIVSPGGVREPFITLEFEMIPLAECYC